MIGFRRLKILMFCPVLALFAGGCGSGETDLLEETPPAVFIDNQVAKSSAPACIYADPQKLVSLFSPAQQALAPGRSGPYTFPGGQFGLQVNFWYWSQQADHAVGSWSCSQGQCNNPDNSGAQFTLGTDCTITTKSPPVYGVGKETYIIADISAEMQNGDCVLTIKPNRYTACVTAACCDYMTGPGKCSEGTQRTYAAGCLSPPP